MKAIKIGMIVCALTFVTGIIGTGATVGKLFSTTELNHVTSLREPLNSEALKEIYIEANVPVRLEIAKDEPYITFENELFGFMLNKPKYQLDIREEGTATYIGLNGTDTDFLGLVADVREEMVLYVPATVIDRVEVNVGWGKEVKILGNFKFKDVKINAPVVNLRLNDTVENLEIVAGWQANVSLTTTTPAKVKIDSNSGDVRLDGQYKEVEIVDFDGGAVRINSTTPYRAVINNDGGGIELEGAVDIAEIVSQYGPINIQSTKVPSRIKVNSTYGDVTIKLPSTTTGFSGIYEYMYPEQTLYSNFDVTSQTIGESKKRIEYGDGKVQMDLQVYDANTNIIY